MNAQALVGLSRFGLRIAPLNPRAFAPRLASMKNRFPSEQRALWRERFLAIARELESTGAPRREPLDPVRGLRARFLPTRSLRGIRLGCVRAA